MDHIAELIHGLQFILPDSLTGKVVSAIDVGPFLEASLAQSFKDFEEGRSYGPFNTAEEMIKSLHKGVKRIRAERRKTKLQKC